MSRFSAHSAGMARVRVVLAGLLASATLLTALVPVSANETTVTNPLVPSSAHGAPSAAIKPPLPFVAPTVGPVIKRAFADDIEQRTTAFLPNAANLSQISAVEAPEEGRWILVDLSEQMVVAYEGKTAIRAFHISSGLPKTPTVVGEFSIRMKVPSQTMSGGDPGTYGYYSLPNVKWVQYFYGEYAFHGSYWHNDFGRPKSHGCINMTNADAKWLFEFTSPTWDGETTWYRTPKDAVATTVIVTE